MGDVLCLRLMRSGLSGMPTCVSRKPLEIISLPGGDLLNKEEWLSHPFLSKAATSSTLMPKMKRFSSPASSAISTLAPSIVPMVRAPLSMNFMLPVPEASVPAVEICSDRSVAGMTVSRPGQYGDSVSLSGSLILCEH